MLTRREHGTRECRRCRYWHRIFQSRRSRIPCNRTTRRVCHEHRTARGPQPIHRRVRPPRRSGAATVADGAVGCGVLGLRDGDGPARHADLRDLHVVDGRLGPGAVGLHRLVADPRRGEHPRAADRTGGAVGRNDRRRPGQRSLGGRDRSGLRGRTDRGHRLADMAGFRARAFDGLSPLGIGRAACWSCGRGSRWRGSKASMGRTTPS